MSHLPDSACGAESPKRAKVPRLCLLGHPIAHSKSPVMYNALYTALGLPWRYTLEDQETAEGARAFLDARDFLSINITMPYKPLAFEAADERTAAARLSGGANVLVHKDGSLVACNVDGQGCVEYLESTGVDFAGKRAVVCGTGPTSLAIMHAMVVAGVAQVSLAGRSDERTRATVERYVQECRVIAAEYAEEAVEGASADLQGSGVDLARLESLIIVGGSYENLQDDIAAADVIVNATPLGMKPDDPAPFNTELLHEGQTVFEAVYGHGITALAAAAQKAGCTMLDGQGMLVAQAVATARIVLECAGEPCTLSQEDMFDMMAMAAGFFPERYNH